MKIKRRVSLDNWPRFWRRVSKAIQTKNASRIKRHRRGEWMLVDISATRIDGWINVELNWRHVRGKLKVLSQNTNNVQTFPIYNYFEHRDFLRLTTSPRD